MTKKKKFKWQKKLIDYKRFERYFDLKKCSNSQKLERLVLVNLGPEENSKGWRKGNSPAFVRDEGEVWGTMWRAQLS